jgi:hypothetical protein
LLLVELAVILQRLAVRQVVVVVLVVTANLLLFRYLLMHHTD